MASKEETLSALLSRGYLKSKPVISAMGKIRRELFVPENMREFAWDDSPLPIGYGQTISAPHMYAFMLEAAQIRQGDCVLEIGTGSGYGAALLSVLAGRKGKVYSVELVPELAERAKSNLRKAGCHAEVIEGDGYHGHAAKAPYDRILVTAACESVPQPLVSQLKVGGRMLLPVGSLFQDLLLVEKTAAGVRQQPILPVMFVPLVKKSEQ